MYKVKFTDIGEGLTEGTVNEVIAKVGDKVKMGDPLFNVETDKVTSDIYAPVDGVVAKILVEPGKQINVGEVVVEIDDGNQTNTSSDDKKQDNKKLQQEPQNVVVEQVKQESSVNSQPSNQAFEQPNFSNNNKNIRSTPLARYMAAKSNVDLNLVNGTGPNQRILIEDVKNYLENGSTKNNSCSSMPSVDIQSCNKKFCSKPDYSSPKINVREFDGKLTFDIQPMNPIRKATVKAMDTANLKAAGFTGFRNIDVTELVNTRNQLKDFANSQNVKLTYLAFIVKAVSLALKDMPNINVRIDEENKQIKYVQQINIGIAVDTPNGLMVPVIKEANKLTILEIAVKINDLATKARNKTLTINDMSNGTFTISNFGAVGLEYATPIVNYPESAILGVGNMLKIPTYIDDELVPRDFMPFSITSDHKVIDGADAGRFLDKVSKYLKNPALLLMA